MAHFAKLNENNIVIEVIVIDNNVLLNSDNIESEQNGIDYLNEIFGQNNWIQTSYNNNFRKNYAGKGYTYDIDRDAFIPIKPFDSWVLNENSCLWEAPLQYPKDGERYKWNEESKTWDLIN